MPKVALDDVDLHYESRGTGAPLLLVPGALGSAETDFAYQLDWFSQHYQVVAPDPRGYGRSRPPDRGFSTDFYQRDCDDMLAVMAELGHQSYAILGWSDGANVAALMAIHEPSRVKGLVLWGGNSFLTGEEVEAFQAIRLVSAWSSRAVEPMRRVYGEELEDLWDSYVGALEKIFCAGGELYRSRLHLIRCPTLILHGEHDPLVPSLHPVTLHEGIAGSELHIFPEGRHNIHIRYRDEFNSRVLPFLSSRVRVGP